MDMRQRVFLAISVGLYVLLGGVLGAALGLLLIHWYAPWLYLPTTKDIIIDINVLTASITGFVTLVFGTSETTDYVTASAKTLALTMAGLMFYSASVLPLLLAAELYD